jgi:uncharacterized protein YcbX
MRKVGTIKEIWRYPVKGMAGESLQSCGLGEKGLNGDRIWALRDTARREIQSCKFRPRLLLCSARCRSDNAGNHIDFYRRHKLDDHTWLEELKATFDREAGEPLPALDQLPQEAVDFVSLRGTFFLVTPFHMVTTATLAFLKGLNPDSDWDVRRFRPNIVIETEPGSEGLVEQAWIGKRLAIGDSRIDCTETAPRCGAVTRAQDDFGPDKSILRTIVKDAEQNVGIYGAIVNGADICIGDTVSII